MKRSTLGLQLLILITYSVTLLNCNRVNYDVYHGRFFEIDYFNADKIEADDWVEIGEVRFKHYRYESDLASTKNALPASRVVRDSINTDEKFVAPFNRMSIAIMLGTYIKSLNKIESKNGFIISDEPLLMTYGKLRLHKADSSEFTIRVSKGYPASVTVLDFDR